MQIDITKSREGKHMPRKVLYAVDNFTDLIQYHLPYLQAIADKDIELHAAASGANRACPFAARFFSLPSEVASLSFESFSVVRLLIPILRNERYDLIVLGGSWTSYLIRSALLFLPRPHPYVVNIPDGYLTDKDIPFVKRAGALIKEKLLRCVTDEVLALCPEDYAYADHHRLFRDKLLVSSGLGLELSHYHPASALEKSEARYMLGIPEHVQVLLYAENFTARANHEMLIHAMHFLPKDVYLCLPGEGVRLEKSRELAETLGVLPQILFPGTQRSLLPALRAADIAVSAAQNAAFPMFLLSALACGLPAVVSDVKGNRTLVHDNVNGYLYPSGNEYQFADRVIRIYSDRALERRLGEASLEIPDKYALSAVQDDVIHALLF